MMDTLTNHENEKTRTVSIDVEKEISLENNKINNMTKKCLKETAKENKLSLKGTAKVLNSRLKSFVRKQKLTPLELCEHGLTEHENLIIIDFEATCDEKNNLLRQEIIEFPAILFNTKERKIVNEFRSYVKPTINPKLTNFCHDLTGITQADVDQAPLFCEVLRKFEEWLKDNNLDASNPNFTIVTDGSSDIGLYLLDQCEISGVELPKWGGKWNNIKKTYSNFYQYNRLCLKDMISHLGMQLVGRLHQGIDDARNISRIAKVLLVDGAQIYANECLVDDATAPKGYTLSNIIKKENETIIEKKVLNESNKNFKKTKDIKERKGFHKQQNFILDNSDFPVLR